MSDSLTGHDNFFEDFVPGVVVRHWRGKTVGEFETSTLAQLVMNTADGHFDAHVMLDREFGAPIAFGGIVASLVLGLASQDTAEQATEEISLDRMRFPHPVRAGDTIYATTEVLEAADDDGATGRVTFRHQGHNEQGVLVCELERRVRLRRRPGAVAS